MGNPIIDSDDNVTEVKFLPNNFEEGAQWASEQVGIALLSKWDCKGISTQNYQDLITRIYKIYEKNPWLTAMIKQDYPKVASDDHRAGGSLSMLISEKRADSSMETKNLKVGPCQFIYQEVRPDFFGKGMKEQMGEAEEFVVKAVKEHMVDPTKIPLSKFTVIRDSEEILSCTKIAIVVSINHIIGDGGTLYQVYNMLSLDKEPISLQMERIPYEDALKNETSFVCEDGKPFLDAFFGAHMMPFIRKSLHRARVNYDGRYDFLNWIYKLDQTEIKKIKDQHSNADVPFISTNDIIVSWLFNFNKKADNVVVAADLRERLTHLKSSNRGEEFLAGNYVITPTLRHDDIKTPAAVRIALKDIFEKKTNGSGHLKIPSGPELMKYNTGMSTNWCKFYKKVTIPGLKLEMCVPHQAIKLEKFMGVIPCCEEGVIVFQMNDNDIGLFIMAGSGRITTQRLEQSAIVGECVMPEVNLWPENLLAKRSNPPKLPFFKCFFPKGPKEDLLL